MKTFALTTLMALLVGSVAYSDEPAPAPPESSVANAPSASASEATDAAAAEKDAQQNAEREKRARLREANAIKQLRAQGYKPLKQKNGDTVYCRNEAPLGSRLEQQRCSSLQAMLDTELKGQELTKRLFDMGVKNINLYPE